MITNEMPNQVFFSSVIQADKRDLRFCSSDGIAQTATAAYERLHPDSLAAINRSLDPRPSRHLPGTWE